LNTSLEYSTEFTQYDTQIIEKTTNLKTTGQVLKKEFYINKFCEYKQIPGIVKYISFAPESQNNHNTKNTKYSIFMKEYPYDVFDHFVKNSPPVIHLTIENIYPRLSEIIHIARQIACSLSLMHQHNIIHRDIKPENIFIDHNMNTFIGDFGFSEYNPIDTVSNICGTENYVDPNLYNTHPNDHVSGKATDVYSFGVTLWCILFNSYPFLVKEQPFNIYTIPSKYVPFLQIPFINLIIQMIQKDQNQRPNMSCIHSSLTQFQQSQNEYKYLTNNIYI
tara:strand:+ start:3125 stop:3955 length:831 start_codon:yes stop_codon:yes gene_type:complete